MKTYTLEKMLSLRGPVTLLLLLAACSEPAGLDKNEDAAKQIMDLDLVGVEWQLTSLETTARGNAEVGSQDIFIRLREEGRLSGRTQPIEPGSGGSNSFFGIYQANDDGFLSIDSLGTTLVGEVPGSRYSEFYALIREARAYEIAGDRLRIRCDGEKALNFKAHLDASPTDSP